MRLCRVDVLPHLAGLDRGLVDGQRLLALDVGHGQSFTLGLELADLIGLPLQRPGGFDLAVGIGPLGRAFQQPLVGIVVGCRPVPTVGHGLLPGLSLQPRIVLGNRPLRDGTQNGAVDFIRLLPLCKLTFQPLLALGLKPLHTTPEDVGLGAFGLAHPLQVRLVGDPLLLDRRGTQLVGIHQLEHAFGLSLVQRHGLIDLPRVVGGLDGHNSGIVVLQVLRQLRQYRRKIFRRHNV